MENYKLDYNFLRRASIQTALQTLIPIGQINHITLWEEYQIQIFHLFEACIQMSSVILLQVQETND